MQRSIRKFFLGTPLLGAIYCWARRRYHSFLTKKAAKRYFVNFNEYRAALYNKGDGTVDIRTADGLVITIRRNILDARVLQEVFLANPYVSGLTALGPDPVVVDIGAYIGDFALYAIKHFGARQVFAYEPSKRNFSIMRRNIETNQCEDRIVSVNMAVSDTNTVFMDIDVPDSRQINVSVYQPSSSLTRVPSVTLKDLFDIHKVESVDFLKLDCEGSEYAILLSAPLGLFGRIRNIAMEFHEIEGFKQKLNAVIERLRNAGYAVSVRGDIMSASRA
jgi:FkbM family methyltransferase